MIKWDLWRNNKIIMKNLWLKERWKKEKKNENEQKVWRHLINKESKFLIIVRKENQQSLEQIGITSFMIRRLKEEKIGKENEVIM